jgi:hypothetical protein
VSQTGRFLRHFVYEGFNEDEQGARVFDGLIDQVGGAGRGSFNHRFGQQSRDQLQHFNILYPVDMFPFTDVEQLDPETGITDGLLARATRTNTVPKFFHVLTDSEYFNRAGSLVHTGRQRHPRCTAAGDQPHLFHRVSPAHRRHISARTVRRCRLRWPRRHEHACLHTGDSRAVPGDGSLGRRWHGGAAEPLSDARRRHADGGG